MTAYAKDMTVLTRLERAGIDMTADDARTLRRAELTLRRWAEGECGDGNAHASWCIERDDDGTTWRAVYPHTGETRRYRIPDRERGAIRRVADVCERNGLHYYHQTDPRGCSLYVSREPIDEAGRNRGVACCGD